MSGHGRRRRQEAWVDWVDGRGAVSGGDGRFEPAGRAVNSGQECADRTSFLIDLILVAWPVKVGACTQRAKTAAAGC